MPIKNDDDEAKFQVLRVELDKLAELMRSSSDGDVGFCILSVTKCQGPDAHPHADGCGRVHMGSTNLTRDELQALLGSTLQRLLDQDELEKRL